MSSSIKDCVLLKLASNDFILPTKTKTQKICIEDFGIQAQKKKWVVNERISNHVST